jgi:hypothetical protein
MFLRNNPPHEGFQPALKIGLFRETAYGRDKGFPMLETFILLIRMTGIIIRNKNPV